MKNKIVFFDIDGTLLDHEKKLPKETIEAVETLKANGHTPAIATGRAPFAIKEVADALDIHTYVCLNGQFAVHKDQPVYENALNADALARLVETSADKQHPLVFMDEMGWVANVKAHPHVDKAINSLRIPTALGYDPEAYLKGKIYQALLFCEEMEEESYVEEFNAFDFVRWHEVSTDIIPKHGSKAIGIQKMIDQLEFDMTDVYAFGDGLNDIEMLETVPNSVAMGNALPEVKQAAKHVTAAVDQDGIRLGLRNLGLI